MGDAYLLGILVGIIGEVDATLLLYSLEVNLGLVKQKLALDCRTLAHMKLNQIATFEDNSTLRAREPPCFLRR